jgi:hypothetical protein
MTERDKEVRDGLALLQELKQPEWMRDMQRYYQQHGRFRAEDLHRLMETAGQTTPPIPQQEARGVELLQHLATRRK